MSRNASSTARRVTVVPNGPVLVEGPVELVTDDGVTHTSDRFVVAVCACRRSKRYPFCDTSHRKRVRSDDCPERQDDSR
ncbi:CDGSH iron-sulfur domain-containing protein [Lentzea sp. NPDC004789]